MGGGSAISDIPSSRFHSFAERAHWFAARSTLDNVSSDRATVGEYCVIRDKSVTIAGSATEEESVISAPFVVDQFEGVFFYRWHAHRLCLIALRGKALPCQ